jgi:hypothetical protein
MGDVGPFPFNWFYDPEIHTQILPWFPLPSNLINKSEEWIPEVHLNATVGFHISIRIGQSYKRSNVFSELLLKSLD